jgi:O-antigen/teichoic acid export membrane protein
MHIRPKTVAKTRLRPSQLVKIIKKNPFLHHNLTFFAGSLAVATLNYLFYPVLGRMLSPADFGEVQTLTSLFLQASIFLTILSYVTIHVTVNITDEHERNQTLLGLERVAIIVGYSLLALALASVNYLRVFLNFTQNWPFVALIAALAISIPLAFRMAYLRGQKLFFRTSLTDGIGSGSKLILAPIFVAFGGRSFGAIGALAISQVISLLAGFTWARRAGFPSFGSMAGRLRIELVRPYFKHAGAILLGAGGVTLIQTIDILTIKHYFPATQAGLYSGITVIAAIIYFLMTPITGVLMTLVSVNEPRAKNQLRLKASLGIMALLGGSALLVMTLFPELVIKILVGPKYLANAHYLPRISLTMLLLGASNALMMYHIGLKRYRYSIASIACFLLVLGLMRLNHGTIGAVVNNVMMGSFALFVITILQNYIFNHHYKEVNRYAPVNVNKV